MMGKRLFYICGKGCKRKTEEQCMNKRGNIVLGNDYDSWYDYGIKEPITSDITPKTNTHLLLCGLSGSGKSYALLRFFREVVQVGSPQDEYYFGDFKQDDSFAFLRKCNHYYPYKKVLDALNIVYEKMHRRQSGEDNSRYGITLIIDEYAAFILALQGEDKKKATEAMNKVSEILMLGRSLAVRIVIAVQRADAKIFENGARINFGIIVVLGSALKSSYEMVMPKEFIEEVGERKFKTGEGILLLQGAELHFIKIPLVKDMQTMQEICVKALS